MLLSFANLFLKYVFGNCLFKLFDTVGTYLVIGRNKMILLHKESGIYPSTGSDWQQGGLRMFSTTRLSRTSCFLA